MVEVAVREQDGDALEVVGLDVVEDGVGLVARVDDDAFERLLVGNDVAVGLDLTDGEGFDQHAYSSFVSRSMVTGPSLTEATCISAAKTPVSTVKPLARHSATTSS